MSRFGVFLLTLLWAVLAQAEPLLQASVDRTRLEAGESLELTLESQDVTQFGTVSYTHLTLPTTPYV